MKNIIYRLKQHFSKNFFLYFLLDIKILEHKGLSWDFCQESIKWFGDNSTTHTDTHSLPLYLPFRITNKYTPVYLFIYKSYIEVIQSKLFNYPKYIALHNILINIQEYSIVKWIIICIQYKYNMYIVTQRLYCIYTFKKCSLSLLLYNITIVILD